MANNNSPYNVGSIVNYLSRLTGNDSLNEGAKPLSQDNRIEPIRLIIGSRDEAGTYTEHRFSSYTTEHEGTHTVSRFCKKSVYLKHDEEDFYIEVVKPDYEILELNVLIPQDREDIDVLSLFNGAISSATFVTKVKGYFEWEGTSVIVEETGSVLFAGTRHIKFSVTIPIKYFGRNDKDKLSDHKRLSKLVDRAKSNLLIERNPWRATTFGSPAFSGEIGLEEGLYYDDWVAVIRGDKLFLKFADVPNFYTETFAIDVEPGACFPTIQVTKDGYPIVSYLLPESSSAVITRINLIRDVKGIYGVNKIGQNTLLIPNVRDLILMESPLDSLSKTNVGVFYVDANISTINVGEIRGNSIYYLHNEKELVHLPAGMLLTQSGKEYLPNIFGSNVGKDTYNSST